MALIKCPECSNAVSDRASSCPKCGHPLRTAAPQPPAGLDALIKETIGHGEGKIAAIKLYREYNPSAGLADAKQYVERIEAGLPPGTVTKPPPQGCSPIVAFGGLFIVGCVVFAIWATLEMQKSGSSNSPHVASPAVPDVSPAQSSSDAALSSIAWSEVDAVFNLKSKNTDLQKDDAWKSYKGKRVRWSGTVSSVSESFGSLSLQVKMNPDTFTSDLLITLRDLQKSRALSLKKGDSVSFTGVLDRWGSLLPITLKDGEILY